MTLENIQNWVLPFASSIAIILAGVAFFFTKLRELKENASRELIDTLKETAVAEREKAERLRQENKEQLLEHQGQIAALEKQINDIKLELMAIKAQAESAEKSNQEYLKIIQGVNPEMKAILTDIRDFMKSLDKKAVKNEKRNERVDSDTSKGKGKVLRIKEVE